jgi:hypothetical protein
MPGVNGIKATVLEVPNITGRKVRPSHLGDGCDLGISMADRSAESTAVGGNLGKSSRRIAVEPKDAARQILGKHSLRRCQQTLAPFAPGEQLGGWPILNFAFLAKFRVGMLEAVQNQQPTVRSMDIESE